MHAIHGKGPCVWSDRGRVEDETRLMVRVGAGDLHALSELYDRLGPRVYALAMRMLDSAEEAEEVLQDTFLNAHRHGDRYRPSLGSPRTFLYTIARNAALSRLRARAVRPAKATWADVHDPAAAFAGPASDDLLTRMWLKDAMDGIETGDSELIRLAFFAGHSHRELAARTGLPLGTVKSRLRRAMARLRSRLEGRDAS